ncbi:Spo0E family sporulation regulatory protein-aspartic acid phosphatase [Senegalia massiliensis]|uniref:Spo0E family sporulation regulatory protein-aspartic acid phosphatase n=1 Tax=Senegalia massiliensis TaxID=1720316 RepID=A0A845R277_9CLOT|nr:Spo0E family sporulation regulatory protein-aspartic acid phosphatase [Senegalia massiliensis]NBI06683.1 Spo0E family sporulation regulatory protein-aspartic acid phosphatase [Senegalia massiliensis]
MENIEKEIELLKSQINKILLKKNYICVKEVGNISQKLDKLLDIYDKI